MILEKQKGYLEGSLMPEAKFLQDIYYLALTRYQLAAQYAQDKVILDAGCGSGYGSEELAKAGAKKVYGVDLVPDSIVYSRIQHHHQNLVFRQGDLTNLDFPGNFFDLICAFEVVEHIKDYPKALAEFYRILKPGGLLIISTPNKAVYSPDTKKPFYPFHYYEFYLNDLKKMLKNFQIKKLQGQYIKGRKMMLYSPWSPKRFIRIIFANLPLWTKILATRSYLKIYFWAYQIGLYRPQEIKLSDVYLSDDLSQTRVFVVIGQKPKGLVLSERSLSTVSSRQSNCESKEKHAKKI